MPQQSPLPIAIRELLELSERLYFERSILETLLKESGLEWKEKYDQALQSPRLRAHVHGIFERAAVQLHNAEDCERDLQALLAELADKRKPN